jgi:putative ABC transport system substrate-binding protein
MQFSQLKRRTFITLLGGATAWPLVVRAQEMRRVGALLSLRENDPEGKVWLRAFQDELQRLGWEQGRSIQIEYRWAGSDEDRLRAGAAELVGMRPDVLFTSGTPALVALSQATRSLPIVFVQVADPVNSALSQVSHGRVETSPGLLPSKPRLSANGLNCSKIPLQAGTGWRSF